VILPAQFPDEKPGPPAGRQRDEAIEGLRVAAALAVLYAHLTSPFPVLDPNYVPSAVFWRFEAAVPAVMIFFLISGYVIGLAHRDPPSAADVGKYLRRRALRLLPAYFAAVLLGWFAVRGPSFRDLVGNFFFLQNAAPGNPFHIQLLNGNPNLWSLHYEVVYYLGFLLLWRLRPPLVPILLLLFFAGALGALVHGFSLWAAWLGCGGVLWVLGLGVAWHAPAVPAATRAPWPSALLLGLATWQLHALHILLARIGHPIAWLPGITFDYLDTLPVLFWLFLLVTRRTRWRQSAECAAWILPIAYLGWRACRGTMPATSPAFTGAALTILALALRSWKPSLAPFQRLAPLGAASYGLYAFGGPVQAFIHGLWPNWSGTMWSYGLRALLDLALLVLLAVLFERLLQPRIRNLFTWDRPAAVS
jgi:peptidoglycan/LPS O-acetylase OafA/YrhL